MVFTSTHLAIVPFLPTKSSRKMKLTDRDKSTEKLDELDTKVKLNLSSYGKHINGN